MASPFKNLDEKKSKMVAEIVQSLDLFIYLFIYFFKMSFDTPAFKVLFLQVTLKIELMQMNIISRTFQLKFCLP